MKIIQTKIFQKLAASWDDQAGFTGSDGGTRYRNDQAGSILMDGGIPEGKNDVIRKWKKRRRPGKIEEMPKPSI